MVYVVLSPEEFIIDFTHVAMANGQQMAKSSLHFPFVRPRHNVYQAVCTGIAVQFCSV